METKVVTSFFTMTELLLCGVGNEVIYDKEQEARKINFDGMQRTSYTWNNNANSLVEKILKEPIIPATIKR